MDYQEEECLFCEEIWWEAAKPAQILFSGSRYLGKDCPSLESQLKQLFILRRILDIPLEWCEEKLGGSEGDNPSNWFGICGGCTPIVEKAVDVHHKILELESKFQKLKEKVKEKMGSGRSSRKGRRRGRRGEEDIRQEIRRIVIGEEAIVKSEVGKPNYEEFYDDNDNDFNYQQDDEEDNSNDPAWNWNEGETSIMEMDQESQSELKKRKGRGRPPRGEERPPGFYLRKDGKVRRVTFHLLKCTKCPAKYKRQEDFNAHTALHDSPSKHPCPECSFPCKSKEEFARHHRKKHKDLTSSSLILRYGCVFEDCQFSTYSPSELDNHCEEEHPSMPLSDLKRMRCPLCSKTFGNQKSLSVHQHRKHPELMGMEAMSPSSSPATESRGVIHCEECGLSFTSKLHLYDHVRNTHERVQRHICDECGKGFRFNCQLESHKTVHKKEREFVCHHCGLDYPAKQTLVNHIRKIHSENSSAVAASAEVTVEGEEGATGGEDSGEVFTCKYCELTSPFKVVIRRHQLTHKVEMGHQCDICQKCYTSDSGLRRHVRINHPTQEEVVECTYCRKPFGNKDYMIDHVRKFCLVRKGLEGGGGGDQVLATPISTAVIPPPKPSLEPPLKIDLNTD